MNWPVYQGLTGLAGWENNERAKLTLDNNPQRKELRRIAVQRK